jgi:hypothetical protein
MKILINDKLQSASGVPNEIITPMLSDIYNAETEFTATFPQGEKINCIGIGYTDATEFTVRNDNPWGSAVMNLPLVSDALDISGNGNDGTPTNIDWTGGVANFNGTNSRIVVNPSPVVNLTGKSMEFRFFKDSALPATTEYIFRLTQDENNRFNLEVNSSGKLNFTTRVDGSFSAGRTTVNDLSEGAWHHVVLVFISSSTFRFVIDGVPEPIQTITQPLFDLTSPVIHIGSNVSSRFLNASISQFSLYDGALTQEEITSLYNGDMLQTVPITKPAPYHSGLYLLKEINGTKYTISHNGTFVGRVAVGEYRKLGVNPTMEIGFYTTNESRITESGQVIPGAGGMTGRTFDADIRYKFDRDVYNDLELAYRDQISRGFPYFLLLDDEQHKLPANMLRFYGGTDSPLSKLQSSTYKFLYSYRFEFKERF